MNLFKILMAKYGVFFFFSFMGAFIVMLTIGPRNGKPLLLPTDVWVQNDKFTLYLPFGTSILIAALLTVGFQIYLMFRR